MCVDVLAGIVVAIDSAGGLHHYPVPSRAVTVIRRRARGGFIVAGEHGLLLADDELAEFEDLAELVADPAVRTNDGGCDPLGGFVIGTMAYDERPNGGAVYRVTPDRRVIEVLAPVSISNGIQWSSDGTRVFYIDTPTRCVDVFDVEPESGTWSRRRTHIRIECAQGSPDGMAIDEEDGLWIALWGGGAVVHYDAAGRLVEMIAIPGVSQISSCAFGGDGRCVLYVTTSRKDLPPGSEPNAGAVYSVHTSTRGASQAEFGG
jgi:sugar lactone lactonase YvrE